MFDPDQLPPLREVIANNGLRAQKSLGQNFLLDLNITDKIARAAGDLTGTNVIEIGPGPGGLTRSLLKTDAKKVYAVEYDPRAVKALHSLEKAAGDRLEIIQADALKITLPELAPGGSRAIVANLPYNIATPLLTGWLAEIYQDPGVYSGLTLLFQKEVADRICASPGSKAYGRLSILTQWLCNAQCCFDIPPQAFTPAPKVTSTLIHLLPKNMNEDHPPFPLIERITAAAFGQRRKMVRSSMKEYSEFFKQAGINPEARAENLPVSAYIDLARLVANKDK